MRKRIIIPEVSELYPKKIRDRHDALVGRRDALNEHHNSVEGHRQQFKDRLDGMDAEDDAEAFKTSPGAVVSGEENFEAANLRDLDFNLLREERILRKDLDEFIGD